MDEAFGARAQVVGNDSHGDRIRTVAVIVLVTG